MWSRATPIKQRAKTDGLELLAVWEVNADPAYRVVWDKAWNAGFPPTAHVAWITVQGRGQVAVRDGRSSELCGGSLLFTRCHDLDTYFCSGKAWHFFWMVFTVPLPAQIPVCAPLEFPEKKRCQRDLLAIVRALRKGTDAPHALAAAIFQKLFHEWLTTAESRRRDIPHQAKIEQIIEEMHNRPDGTFSLPDMAKTVGMCEVVFRRRFKAVTGQSPKKFYLDLRLDQAAALLQLGQLGVGEVASTLGFYDQFHFSKVFQQRFAKPTSSLRRHRPAKPKL